MNRQPQFSLSQFKRVLDANRAKIAAVKADLADLQSSQRAFRFGVMLLSIVVALATAVAIVAN